MTKATTSHPEAHRILAYADGRLPVADAADVEKLIAHDPDAAELLRLFKKSALPFAEAFDEMATDTTSKNKTPNKPVNSSRKSVWRTAAILVIGLFGGWLGSDFQYRINHQEPPDWIMQVANYQLLYVRSTVEDASVSDHTALKEKLTQALGSEFKIPNLVNHDLKFMRGQILEIDGAPLIQLAYLPTSGPPVVVCITPKIRAGNKPEQGIANGLSYVRWSDQELSYVMMGNMGDQPLYNAAMEAVQQI